MYNDLVFTENKSEFWKYLIVISSFYILPSLQFVIFQEISDKDNLCYFNKKCQHSLGIIPSFNNVISNIFYCIYGLLFIGTVKYSSRFRSVTKIDMDPSLYYTLGVGLFLEGIFSAIFHICPSKLNFQFDTTFMFFGVIIMFLIIYQKRHPKKIPTPFKIYLLISCIVFINIIPLLEYSKSYDAWSWSIFYLLTIYILVNSSTQLYLGDAIDDYVDDDNYISFIDKCKLVYRIKDRKLPQFILVIFLNLGTITMLILGHIYKDEILFTNWVLCLFIINLIIYTLYYIIQKVNHNEHIYLYKWIMLLLSIVFFITAIVFFEIPVSNKELTHEESDNLNKECVLFDYWDYHDIWHILSATAIFIFINLIYYLDTDTYTNDEMYEVF